MEGSDNKATWFYRRASHESMREIAVGFSEEMH